MLKAFATAFALLSAGTAALAQDARAGDLVFEKPWVRPANEGLKVTGGFVLIKNTGKQADKLLGASVKGDVAERVELHSMSMEGNVMKMREVTAIDIPAGGELALKPGSYHLMVMGLKAGIKAGAAVPVKLKFEKAGEVEVTFKAEGMMRPMAPAASKPAEDHSHHQH